MIDVSMIISFLIVLCLVIAGVQYSMWWTFQMSLPNLTRNMT
jgi:hypothetical protein